jgi:hypothetical protein
VTPPSPPLAEADVIIIIDRPDRPSSIVPRTGNHEKGIGDGAAGDLTIVRPAAGMIMAHRRVLALTFGPDFIHWRQSGESWPSVWPGRRLFFLRNAPAAARPFSYGVGSARAGLCA